MTCPRCRAVVSDTSRFCPACGSAVAVTDAPTELAGQRAPGVEPAGGDVAADDAVGVTRLAHPSAPKSSGHRPPTSSGWLGSSGAIDHGRFEPGAIVDGRYRVVGLLGRGGMGEVYRADDMRLGQTVALKFLPDGLGRDPLRLAQFHNEVRTARQVSHPNVCRVHDIGEVDGHLYLSMEYVDGEDLATSLRRIGRFPEDKALEIARQICAGLAAAHERGVLHRDLKPANIMLDGSGRARLMDFGLAVVGEAADIRAGTPAYMAPEQLQGREVTAKSDIFALGLVLYELFTGKRVFNFTSVADLVSQHDSGHVTRPTELVGTIPVPVERAILRCLERDPARRPASALAVSASLPGGDPLAAALAAGETPSPDVVAASGGEAPSLSPVLGVGLVLATAIGLLLSAILASRHQLIAEIDLPLHPRTLVDRARALEGGLAPSDGWRDRAHGLFTNGDIEGWLWSQPVDVRRRLLSAGWPSPVLFWQRGSPRLLLPSDPDRLRPTRGDPPLAVADMTIVALGMDGRLMEFLRVPRQIEGAGAAAAGTVDWSAFFTAAGLDMGRFAPAAPEWTPRFFADDRRAWVETTAGDVGVPLRVEAASHQGEPVNFQIIGPWARPVRQQQAADASSEIIFIAATVIIVPAVIVGGVLVARRNLRLGRGDRRGALALATAVFVVSIGVWLFGGRHVAAILEEQTRFARALASALFASATYALLYLAFEPTVRRVWPQMLVTWSRLISGRLRDPQVGRDLVIGAVAGLLETLVTFGYHMLPGLMGWPEFRAAPVRLEGLLDLGQLLGGVFVSIRVGLENAVLGAVGLVLVRMAVGRLWATFLVAMVLFSPLAAQGQVQGGVLALDLTVGALLVAIVLFVILRFGIFAGIVTFSVHLLTKDVPLTLDGARFYFATSATAMAVVLGLAVLGFVWSRADQPLFGRLADD